MITRLIYVSVPANKVEDALADWKKVCAPLMMSEPGCVSEKLLRCNDQPNEFISVSEWESMEAIKAYRVSPAHQKIKDATTEITAQVVVKTYKDVG
jgi:quinol monooxygenase YgiN